MRSFHENRRPFRARVPIRSLAFVVVVPLALIAAPQVASANPRPLPFTYPYATLPEDVLEIEQYVDVTPVKAEEPLPDGSTHRVFDRRYVLQTELEYGITDHLELGAYLVFQQAPSASDPSMRFDGTKQRLRYRLAEEGVLPVDLAGYFEVVELHDELELEQKVIVGKRFGALSLMANAWIEEEFERGKDAAIVYNPTAGFSYQLHPKLHLGVEYWARGRFKHAAQASEVDEFNLSAHHFVGPAISLQLGRLWWSVAAYARVDHVSRAAAVGDDYGKIWVRSVMGFDL